MSFPYVLIRPKRRALPFDNPQYLYALKYDGFRAALVTADGAARFISRNGVHLVRFDALARLTAKELRGREVVLDGELVCLDQEGCPDFWSLLFGRRPATFFAFDLLFLEGVDYRPEALVTRKHRLRQFLGVQKTHVHYVSHVPGKGTALFQLVSAGDLEGIVAKRASEPYDPRSVTWWKIKHGDTVRW